MKSLKTEICFESHLIEPFRLEIPPSEPQNSGHKLRDSQTRLATQINHSKTKKSNILSGLALPLGDTYKWTSTLRSKAPR
jgi:hypothetical protein